MILQICFSNAAVKEYILQSKSEYSLPLMCNLNKLFL